MAIVRVVTMISLGSLFLVMGLASESLAGESRRGVKNVVSFLEMRQKRVVLQEYDISCGAAALATVLRYQHGDLVTEQEVAKWMLAQTDSELVRAQLGFSLLDLKRYAENRGYLADGFGGLTLLDLVNFGPAIVPVRINRTYDHFVVFRGITGNRVVVADPAFGNRSFSAREFLEIWSKRIAFVVRTEGETGGTSGELGVNGNALGFPSTVMVRVALP